MAKTNPQGKDILGVGSVINTAHEGPTKRPTETRTEVRMEKDTSFPPTKRTEAPMNNPGFLRSSSDETNG